MARQRSGSRARGFGGAASGGWATAGVALLVLSVCAACSGAGASSGASASPRGVASEPVDAASAAPASDGVEAVVTGIPIVGDDGTVRWCADGVREADCTGVAVTGLSKQSVDRLRKDPNRWSVKGRYDGRALAATAAPQTAYPEPLHPTTPCTQLHGRRLAADDVDPSAKRAVERYAATIPDRHAGTFWDRDNAVLTVLLTGHHIGEHRDALERAVGDHTLLCVQGGARFTVGELDRAQERIERVLPDAGVALMWTDRDVADNRIDVMVSHSDETTRALVTQAAGAAARVDGYVVLPDAAVADLPHRPREPDDRE